ncbi:MAG TPA: protein-L-isoaspartate O-methyltransferase [Candidatus Moranbacteria bacterium]|nr:protein-L-isoaspartate O-methyltransferase [Candidatus Moranbacteria bacterium]
MSKLVNDLMRRGYLKADLIIDAFSEISRIEFVPPEFESQASVDIALPIGYGQTVSQPLTVAFMFDLLDPQRDQRILDVGSGSGWTTALLSYVVGKNGKVIALEIKEELRKIGEKNVDKFSFVKKGIARFILSDGNKGFPQEAPYDRILVSAEAEFVPDALKKQLKIGGKMVIPVRHSLWYLEKRGEDDFYKEEYPGFAFVPLITEN